MEFPPVLGGISEKGLWIMTPNSENQLTFQKFPYEAMAAVAPLMPLPEDCTPPKKKLGGPS